MQGIRSQGKEKRSFLVRHPVLGTQALFVAGDGGAGKGLAAIAQHLELADLDDRFSDERKRSVVPDIIFDFERI